MCLSLMFSVLTMLPSISNLSSQCPHCSQSFIVFIPSSLAPLDAYGVGTKNGQSGKGWG